MKRLFLLSAIILIAAGSAWAAPFTAAQQTDVLVAPVAGALKVESLAPGTIVEVTHQAGTYWRVSLPGGKAGYVAADSLKQTQSRFALPVPLIIAAAAPIGKVVLAGAIKWFKNVTGMGAQADQLLSIGQELIVLAQEAGGWLKVKDAMGLIGYIQSSSQIVPLQTVQYAPPAVAGVWQNSSPIPSVAAGLVLQVEVRKLDGTYVPPGGTLRLGDQYMIVIVPSADCYVRITCDTPDRDFVCQYYPNQFPDTQTTIKLKAGRAYSTEFLPAGKTFMVSQPIGRRDVLRIEATTAAPFHYVARGDGCAMTTQFQSGGFSLAGSYANPTAQTVVEYPLETR